MKRLLPLFGLLFLACNSTSEIKVVHPDGVAVRILPTHTHSRYCGHYRFQDTWYFKSQHRHGTDCGHVLIGGVWTLEE
jgi:hypothetical protein